MRAGERGRGIESPGAVMVIGIDAGYQDSLRPVSRTTREPDP